MGLGGWWTGLFIALVSLGVERLTVAPPSFFDLVPESGPTRTTTATPSGASFDPPTEPEDMDDERVSFFRRRRDMAPVSKWSWIYVSTGPGHGKVVLAIGRLHPKKRNDASWTVVSTLNINDRRRVSVKRAPGITCEEFAGLSREVKREAEEASRDLVLRASRPSLGSWGRKISWILTPVTVSWSWSMFGFTGLGLSLAWRSAQYFQVFGFIRSLFEVASEFQEVIPDATDFIDRMEEAWSRGDFELRGIIIGSVIFVSWGLWAWARWIFPSSTAPPPPSESGSEAGHSLPVSEDEKETTTEMKNFIETLQAEVESLREEKVRAGRRRPSPTRRSMEIDPSSAVSSAWGVPPGDMSESDSSASAGLPMPPNPETMMPAVGSILKRLREHETAVHMDRAFAPRAWPPEESTPPPPGLARSSAGATAGSDVDAARLQDALRDPRERVLEQLEGFKPAVDWSFTANISERVAPLLLAQISSTRPSATQMAPRWVQDRQLERNHMSHTRCFSCTWSSTKAFSRSASLRTRWAARSLLAGSTP